MRENTLTHASEGQSGHFGPCPDCPHAKAPAFQLTATSDRPGGKDCQETARRAGPPGAYGTAEHEIIQAEFKRRRPMGAREYQIPESGSKGGTGWADVADLGSGAIFEIKSGRQETEGALEAARYVAMAKKHCGPQHPWHLGTDFVKMIFPSPTYPGKETVAKQSRLPGVIYYYERNRSEGPDPVPVLPGAVERQPQREPRPEQNPIADPIPASPGMAEAVRDWFQRVLEESKDPREEAHRFFEEHPEWAVAIIVIGVLGIAALVLDDATIVGIADDFAIPILATLIAVAWEYV